jgi:hypothetical protein
MEGSSQFVHGIVEKLLCDLAYGGFLVEAVGLLIRTVYLAEKDTMNVIQLDRSLRCACIGERFTAACTQDKEQQQ